MQREKTLKGMQCAGGCSKGDPLAVKQTVGHQPRGPGGAAAAGRCTARRDTRTAPTMPALWEDNEAKGDAADGIRVLGGNACENANSPVENCWDKGAPPLLYEMCLTWEECLHSQRRRQLHAPPTFWHTELGDPVGQLPHVDGPPVGVAKGWEGSIGIPWPHAGDRRNLPKAMMQQFIAVAHAR